MHRHKIGACVCAGAKSTALSVLLIGLAGCDTLKLTLYPTPPPTPADVAGEYKAFSDSLAAIAATESNPAAAYVSMGYSRADEACNDFFTSLRKLRNDTSMAKDATRTLTSAAGVITSLTTAPTAVLTGIFGATGVFPSVIDDFQKTFLFAEAGDSLYPLVSGMMQKYKLNFPAERTQFTDEKGALQTKQGANSLNASLRVRQHASLCSVPYLTYVLKTGVVELTKDTTTDSSTKTTKTITAPAGGAAIETITTVTATKKPDASSRTKVLSTGGAVTSAPVTINGQKMGAP